jgi:glutamate racemase
MKIQRKEKKELLSIAKILVNAYIQELEIKKSFVYCVLAGTHYKIVSAEDNQYKREEVNLILERNVIDFRTSEIRSEETFITPTSEILLTILSQFASLRTERNKGYEILLEGER